MNDKHIKAAFNKFINSKVKSNKQYINTKIISTGLVIFTRYNILYEFRNTNFNDIHINMFDSSDYKISDKVVYREYIDSELIPYIQKDIKQKNMIYINLHSDELIEPLLLYNFNMINNSVYGNPCSEIIFENNLRHE